MATKRIGEYNFVYHPRAEAPRYYYDGETLDDCYVNPSARKRAAFDYCKRMAHDLGAENLYIVGHNSMTFSVMFDFPLPETGELMRAHITRLNMHLYHV